MDVIPSLEDGFPPQQFSKDAAHTPNVYGFGVLLPCEDDLRCSIPTCSNVLSHETQGRPLFDPCQSKVAYLQQTITIDEQVAWFQVSMQHMGRVHVLQRPQYLIEEVLAVIIGESLRRCDDLVKISVHELGNEVDIIEVGT